MIVAGEYRVPGIHARGVHITCRSACTDIYQMLIRPQAEWESVLLQTWEKATTRGKGCGPDLPKPPHPSILHKQKLSCWRGGGSAKPCQPQVLGKDPLQLRKD